MVSTHWRALCTKTSGVNLTSVIYIRELFHEDLSSIVKRNTDKIFDLNKTKSMRKFTLIF